METFLHIHDLEGRDVESPANPGDRSSDATTTMPQGGRERILLSMMALDGSMYHATIVLPTSYMVCSTHCRMGFIPWLNVPSQEAMAMAIDSFHTQIKSDRTPVQDLVLKLGMKLLSGEITWSSLRPEQWADVVRDGDEIRLGGGGAEISSLYGPSPLITLNRSVYNVHGAVNSSQIITTVLPKTCEVSYIQIREVKCLG